MLRVMHLSEATEKPREPALVEYSSRGLIYENLEATKLFEIRKKFEVRAFVYGPQFLGSKETAESWVFQKMSPSMFGKMKPTIKVCYTGARKVMVAGEDLAESQVSSDASSGASLSPTLFSLQRGV